MKSIDGSRGFADRHFVTRDEFEARPDANGPESPGKETRLAGKGAASPRWNEKG